MATERGNPTATKDSTGYVAVSSRGCLLYWASRLAMACTEGPIRPTHGVLQEARTHGMPAGEMAASVAAPLGWVCSRGGYVDVARADAGRAAIQWAPNGLGGRGKRCSKYYMHIYELSFFVLVFFFRRRCLAWTQNPPSSWFAAYTS